MSGLEAYYDRHYSTIYLNVTSLFDGPMFLNMCQHLESTDFGAPNNGGKVDIESILRLHESAEMKLLLHAFLLSNLIFLVQDQLQIDMQTLEVLKNVANIKSILASRLEKNEPNFETLHRLLTSPPPTISVVFDAASSLSTLSSNNPPDIDSMLAETQKILENQVRGLLRRPQYENLFTTPSSQFLHVVSLGYAPMDFTMRMLVAETRENKNFQQPGSKRLQSTSSATPNATFQEHFSAKSVQDLRKWLVAKTHAIHASAHRSGDAGPNSSQVDSSHLHSPHSKKTGAQTKKGGAQNAHKNRSKTFSEGWSLATSQEWFGLSHIILQYLTLQNGVSSSLFDDALDADEIFSNESCAHALQSARGTYFAGLPNTYGSIYHQKRIQLALRVFSSLARGPLTEKLKSKFVAECTAYWNLDHRKCDAVSMTNRPCVHNFHMTREELAEANSSALGLKMTAALAASAPSYSPSSSSSTQKGENSSHAKRRAKMDAKAKNEVPPPSPSTASTVPTKVVVLAHSSEHSSLHRCNCGKNQTTRQDPFTLEAANTTFFSNPECCRYLPSLLEGHLRKMRSGDSSSAQPTEKEDVEDLGLLAMPHSYRVVNFDWEATVMGSTSESLSYNHFEAQKSGEKLSTAPTPSTKIYLSNQSGFEDGMDALLPWSINPNGSMGFTAGMKDTNFSPTSSLPHSTASSESISSTSKQQLLAHIGLEYECPLGHRWFAGAETFSSLGLLPSSSAASQTIDIQSVLETSFLPIYLVCSCGKQTAQLQRIYFATPRDPTVRVTFNLLVHVLGKSIGDHSIDAHDGATPKFPLDSGIPDHLVLPPDHLVCIRLPYIYTLNSKPLLQGSMTDNDQCRFFLEPRSFGLVTS